MCFWSTWSVQWHSCLIVVIWFIMFVVLRRAFSEFSLHLIMFFGFQFSNYNSENMNFWKNLSNKKSFVMSYYTRSHCSLGNCRSRLAVYPSTFPKLQEAISERILPFSGKLVQTKKAHCDLKNGIYFEYPILRLFGELANLK